MEDHEDRRPEADQEEEHKDWRHDRNEHDREGAAEDDASAHERWIDGRNCSSMRVTIPASIVTQYGERLPA